MFYSDVTCNMIKDRLEIFSMLEGGTNSPLIEILESTFGTFCLTPEAQTLYWLDNMGSVAKFYNLKGLSKKQAIKKDQYLTDSLVNLTQSNCSQIKDQIIDLLALLPKQVYSSSYKIPSSEYDDDGYNFSDIVFPNFDKNTTDEEQLYAKYNKYVLESSKERPYVC